MRRALLLLLCAYGLASGSASPALRDFAPVSRALAQDGWDPFRDLPIRRSSPSLSERPEPPGTPPRTGDPLMDLLTTGPARTGWNGPRDPRGEPVAAMRPERIERGELSPAMSSDGSGLPAALWHGLEVKSIEDQLAALGGMPRSPTMHALWRRLWVADATPPMGGPSPSVFAAIRAEALLRSGLVAEAVEVLETQGGPVDDPILAYVGMRVRLALGDFERACQQARLAAAGKAMPGKARAESALVTAYCVAAAGTPEAAGLAAELAREANVDAPFALGVLDAVASGDRPRVASPKSLGVLDYRLLALARPADLSQALERADAILLATLARDGSAPAATRLFAAEAAARLSVIEPRRLAEVYRAQSFNAAELADPLAAKPDPRWRRALLVQALDMSVGAPSIGGFVRVLVDEARRAGLLHAVAHIVALYLDKLRPAPDNGPLVEVAVEVYLAAGRIEHALTWAASRGELAHWRALADIADTQSVQRRTDALAAVEQLAIAGRFTPLALHRLATILDALDYQIPIPLWEAASRTPQPSEGHLPETGVLPQLAEAAKRQQLGRAILLAARALGPDGPGGTHIIALGDTIRALRQVGFEAEARRIGFEALVEVWPRTATVTEERRHR